MKFVHRIAFQAIPAQRRQLEALGVKLPAGVALPGNRGVLLGFDVDEAHPNWQKLHGLFQEWNVSDFPRTEFSSAEIEAVHWSEIGAWHYGYPQPDEEVFGYPRATYDLTDWCEQCGIGKKQKAAFQMKGEPRWGRNGLLQLTWVYDEIFATPKVWSRVFKSHGIGCRPVMNTKGAELTTVVQLALDSEVSIATEGLSFEQCSKCGRVKYLPIARDPFPTLSGEPPGEGTKTREYFGSGGQAHRSILVSHKIAQSLRAERVRGGSLTPVRGDETARR